MLQLSGPPNKIYPRYTDRLWTNGHQYSSRNGQVKEMLNPVLEFTNPEFPFLFTHGRMINLAFAMAEVIWILSGKNDLKIPAYFNSQFEKYSDDKVTTNAAYGYRMRHFGAEDERNYGGFDQLEDTILFLGKNPDTRHAAMTYRDPLMDGAMRETNDRACNLISHFLLRDGRLHMMQTIRSSDAIWGVPYNLVQWSHVLRYVAARLKVDVGNMTFHIHSGHMYEQHWEDVDHHTEWDPFEPYYKYREFPLFNNKMDGSDPARLYALLVELIWDRDSEGGREFPSPWVTPFWRPFFNVFEAYIRFKNKDDDGALDFIIEEVPWPYDVLLAKNFFTWRWSKPKFAGSEIQDTALQFGRDHSPRNWFYELVPYSEDRTTGRITLEAKGV